ncbi:MAG: hypothetical protein NZ576_08670 [Bacteroidia bacterium]|nr:hypothetical protein [Bacteroidia bacterium]
MPYSYDSAIKETFVRVLSSLSNRVLGINIQAVEELNLELQATIKRRLDYLARVQLILESGEIKECILHIEFQSRNHSHMHMRMMEYYALLYRKYKLEILQYVIYVGNEPLRMQNSIEHTRLQFYYELIDLREFSSQDFLEAESIWENLLAILANWGGLRVDEVIEVLLHRIINKSQSSFEIQQNITFLETFSHLRGYQFLVVNKLRSMSIEYDISTDLRYLQGKEDGLVIGMKKGMEEGIEKGRKEGIKSGLKKGLKKGLKRGFEKGVLKERVRLAKIALAEGLDIDTVQKLTGLSVDKIKALKGD